MRTRMYSIRVFFHLVSITFFYFTQHFVAMYEYAHNTVVAPSVIQNLHFKKFILYLKIDFSVTKARSAYLATVHEKSLKSLLKSVTVARQKPTTK